MLHTLLYFFALFSLSTAPNWAKLSQMPVEVLGFWRLFVAGGCVGLWIFLSKKKWPHLKNKNFKWVIISGFFFFLHLATYKYAAKNTSVSNTMILFASNPIWASLGAIIFFKEQLSKRLVISYGLAILGIYLLVKSHLQFAGQTLNGDISSLISALMYAAYMLTSKKARQHYDNLIYAFFQYGICALCFALASGINSQNFVGYPSTTWMTVLGLVILPTFLGHFSFTYLVKFMNLSVMTCGKLIEPMLASLIAYFVFNESLQTEAWLAFILTATSVVILFLPDLLKTLSLQERKD